VRLSGFAVLLVLSAAGASAAVVPRDALLLSNASGAISIVDVATGQSRHVSPGSEAVWSPRGARVAFTRTGDVFVVNVSGAQLRRLTRDELVQHNPVWSPDGTHIAFLEQHPTLVTPGSGPQDDVAVVDLRTGAVTRLTGDRDNKLALTWAPDGRTLAYESHRFRRRTVVLIDAVTGEPVGVRADGSYPIWSPDARRIAYVGVSGERASLVVSRSDGSRPRILFRGTRDVGVGDISWSPGGRFIVFVYGGWSVSRTRLQLADTVTGRVRPLTGGASAWTPLTGSALPLAASANSVDFAPAWSPDGRRIAFGRYDGRQRRYVVAVVDRDANVRVLLRSKRPLGAPLWRPRGH
jgi:Tol biopolymer transport system component